MYELPVQALHEVMSGSGLDLDVLRSILSVVKKMVLSAQARFSTSRGAKQREGQAANEALCGGSFGSGT